jgi:hypothetical protein
MVGGRKAGKATKKANTRRLMMQKILGVMGSPRKKGNTHILISKILEGAQSVGAVGDCLFLGDLAIQECDGCHACWKGKECSKNDDMNSIVALRHPAIQILPPCGMMSLKDLKEHHHTKRGGTFLRS